MWTNFSQAQLNAGFILEKLVDGIYVTVTLADDATPVSSILLAFWKDRDIRLNQRRITIQQNAAQISQIINKLSCSREYAETIGVTAGQFDDTANPDEKSNANSGGILRQQKWAKSSPDELKMLFI